MLAINIHGNIAIADGTGCLFSHYKRRKICFPALIATECNFLKRMRARSILQDA
jgi:hypothetical protein